MSKFSVKKPYTVFVAVIIVLVLGAVAFMNMTPDLLPSLDLPYVVLMTAYPGATPERIETEVTRPLERSMATLENIESITSTSNESYSSIVLEFTAEVNMDTITVDILQKVSQIEGQWDDMVQTPLILKLNPSMLPVMVAAVEIDGLDTVALSTLANDTLINQLEGIAGVASVSATGLVEEQLNVVLDQTKIDAQNARLSGAIEEQFAEYEQQMEAGIAEIQNRLSSTQNTMQQLQRQRSLLPDNAQEDVNRLLIDAKLAVFEQIASAQQQLQQATEVQLLLNGIKANVDMLQLQSTALQGQIQQLDAFQQELLRLENQNTQFETDFEAIWNSGQTQPEQEAAIDAIKAGTEYQKMLTDRANLEAALQSAFGIQADHQQIDSTRAALQAQLAGVTGALQTIEQQLATMGLSINNLDTVLAELDTSIRDLETAIAAMEQLVLALDAGDVMAADALAELQKVSIPDLSALSDISLTALGEQMALASMMESIQGQLVELQNQKDMVLEQLNLNSIVSLDTISNILKAQNFSMPAGYVAQDGINYLVRVGDEVKTPEELEQLVLFDPGMDGVPAITLGDVANVFMSDNLDSVYAKINGNDGVLLTFNKQSTYATAEVSQNISDKFKELSEEYEGMSFVPLMDQGDYIYIVVNSIIGNLAWGALFAIIILFLFLKDLKPTFITLCSIPISVLFAIVLMYFSGVTINIISLSGLAVAVGMLVDNSVVVIENVYRLRGKGFSSLKAAVSGAAQVGGAIVASTLTTICVFLPIVFVQGITRQLFTDMALTIAYSLLASLIVAMTLVPAMSVGMLRNAQMKPNKLFDKMLGLYRRAAGWTLGHRALVLALVAVLLVGSTGLTLMKGFSFMPSMDMPQLSVSLEMPEGTELADTRKAADDAMSRIQKIEGVGTVGAMASSGGSMMSGGITGGMGGSSADSTSVTMYVLLDENTGRSGNQVVEEINSMFENLEGFEGEVHAAGSGSMTDAMSALGGTGVSVNVYGENSDDMMAAAKQVAAVLEGLEGTSEVNDGIGETEPEIRFVVDKQKAMEKGLTVAQVFAEISKALTSEASATTVTYEGDDYDVLVVSAQDGNLTPQYIRNYRFTVTNQITNETEEVFIGDIAEIVETETTGAINREDQRRLMTVSAGLEDGHNVSLVTAAAQRAMQNETLPAGISYEFTGENETIMDSFRDLSLMMLLGVLLVYLIMVAQFQSLLSPFIVMFTIPLAFTGGFLALLMTGKELSVIAMIGFIMLTGIIVNNGIVLVDYINQLRAEGMEKRQAIIEAGITRMRPILMTSITTILGLSVMALGRGTGSELMQPVAIVCIGGLVYATILTLFVIPVMYDLLNRKKVHVVAEEELEIVDE